MIILDVVDKYPESEEAFRKLDPLTGGCVMCENLFDDLDEFLKKYNVNKQEFLASFGRESL